MIGLEGRGRSGVGYVSDHVPALIATLALPGPPDRIAEACSGTETVQIGTQPAKTLPYTLTFSADLAGKLYCYDACGKDETYPISDPRSQPIKLADLDRGARSATSPSIPPARR